MKKGTKNSKGSSEAAQRMRKFREEHPQHMRQLWRQAYWRRKGFLLYPGIALGGMEITPKIRHEVDELRNQLHKWNFEYYVWAASTASDAEYDRVFERLKELEKKYPQLEDPNSPTCRVGATIPGGDKFEHRIKMLSLDKVKTPEEVVKFFNSDQVGVLEPKVDGVSLALKYINGRLIQVITRGDGEWGEDVTPNARTIRSLPLIFREGKKVSLEVRGEAFIKWSDFEKLNARLLAEQEEPMTIPRSATIGALGVKHPSDAANVPMSFIAYQIVGGKYQTQTEVLEALEGLGFLTPSALPPPVGECPQMYQAGFKLNDLDEISHWVEALDKARRLQDFPTDGLVFKVDSLQAQAELGVGTTFPKWAVAFKYPPDRVATCIESIEWTVGKTGKVTPVANLKPVLISGTTVARASLCNVNEIKRLGVNVGDEVLIEKSNEIIPKVMQVINRKSDRPAEAPKECPVCSSAIKHFEDYVDVFCTNQNCKAQVEARLLYAVGKNALDVDGCGPQAVAAFVASGVTTLPALFKSDCSCFKGATKKKIQVGLENAMSAVFWRKLSALCVEGWGKTTCQEVATRWPCLPALLDASDDKQLDYIITEGKANEFRVYMKVHKPEFVELTEMNYFPAEAQKIEGGLSGQTFCLTGEAGCSRPILEEEIRKRGGVTKSSVSRKVNFLVVGSVPGAAKLTGARRWGTKILTPDQLFEMMNWRPTPEASDKTSSDKEY